MMGLSEEFSHWGNLLGIYAIFLFVNVYFCSKCSKVRITAYSKILMIAYCFFVIIRESHPFLVTPPPPCGKLKMRYVGLLTGNATYRAKRISP